MWARRLVTVSAPCTRLICWGTKRIPLPHASHWPASPAQRLQTTLYTMSARPPLSRGGPHSSVTEVPFTLEIRFTGAEGGPGKETEVQAERELPKRVGTGRARDPRRDASWAACTCVYKRCYREYRAAQRRKCSKQKTAKTQTGLGVKCHGGKMLWTRMPNARQAKADVCSGGSRKQ